MILTGSKRFGIATPDSDTDYICQWSEENEAALAKLGFNKVTSRYHTPNTVCVYRLPGLDMILVTDIKLAEKVSKIMDVLLPSSTLKKEDRKKAWRKIEDILRIS